MTIVDTDLLDALLDYAEARNEYRECVERTDYDASYYCADAGERVERAAKIALDHLDARITAIVLEQRNGND